MQNQNESNNKPLLYTIIAILVVIIAVLLYMLNNVTVEKDNTEKAKTVVEETLKGKEEALGKAELLLEQYQIQLFLMPCSIFQNQRLLGLLHILMKQ